MPTATPAKPRPARRSTKSPQPVPSRRPANQGTRYQPAPFDRSAVRAASLAGVTDKDLITQFPGLQPGTIRTWRRRDPVWSASFALTKPTNVGGRPRNVDRERREKTQAETIALLEATLPAISQRNSIRAANEVDRALAKVERRKNPLPITSWSEYSQAFRVLKLAAGETTEGTQVQLNIWGAGGIGSSTVAPAFRNVTPAAPAIDAPAGD